MAQWIAESLAASPLDHIGLEEPAPLTGDQVTEGHDAGYVRAVATGSLRSLAQSQGLEWDAERSRLVMVRSGAEYPPAVRRMLDEADAHGDSFDLCLCNAGMGASEECEIGGLTGITRDMPAERERLTDSWCIGRGPPIAFVMAGGYVGHAALCG